MQLKEENQLVSVVAENSRTLTIKTPDDVEKAAQILRDIKVAEGVLSKRKKEITAPLMEGLASARDLFKPFETSLAESKAVVKGEMLAYEVRVEEAEKKLAARVEKGTMKAETAVAKMEDMKVEMNTRIVRKLEIEDETVIPREYLMPDRTKITAALLGGKKVAGASLRDEKIIVTK